jgi:hypothetical protein
MHLHLFEPAWILIQSLFLPSLDVKSCLMTWKLMIGFLSESQIRRDQWEGDLGHSMARFRLFGQIIQTLVSVEEEEAYSLL